MTFPAIPKITPFCENHKIEDTIFYVLHQCSLFLSSFLRDHNGNNVAQLFCVCSIGGPVEVFLFQELAIK